MYSTATPVTTSTTKKCVLSSPEESTDLKKNKLSLSINSESREEDTSDISDLSVMAESMEANIQEAEGDDTGVMKPAHTHKTLAENDLKTIGEIIRASFEPRLNAMITAIIDGVVEGLTTTVHNLQSQVNELQKENADLKQRVTSLETKADAAEQYSRRNCMRISGVPEDSSENTDVYLIDMARATDVEVKLDEIERSHGVGPMKAGRPRDIIVKFTSYRIRRKVYGERTKAKVRGYAGVFMNEDLTKSRKELLMKARRMVKNNLMKSAWSSDGAILVRDLSDTKHRILSESDLAVFGPVPDFKRF